MIYTHKKDPGQSQRLKFCHQPTNIQGRINLKLSDRERHIEKGESEVDDEEINQFK